MSILVLGDSWTIYGITTNPKLPTVPGVGCLPSAILAACTVIETRRKAIRHARGPATVTPIV